MSRKFIIRIEVRSCYNVFEGNCLYRNDGSDTWTWDDERDVPYCSKATGDISYKRRVYAENAGAITKSCPCYDQSVEENE